MDGTNELNQRVFFLATANPGIISLICLLPFPGAALFCSGQKGAWAGGRVSLQGKANFIDLITPPSIFKNVEK